MNAIQCKYEIRCSYTLGSFRRILIAAVGAAILILCAGCQKGASENGKLIAQCFGESLALGEIASQVSLGSSASIPNMSAFYTNAADTFKNEAVSKSNELKISPDKDDMANYGNSLKKSLVSAMASSANDADAQRKYSDAFKNTASVCDRVMKLEK